MDASAEHAMLKLYSYWRSSASYRVRIALNLKGLPYEIVPVHLVRDGGQQHAAAYRVLNPQGRVPLLVDGDFHLNQSLAILDYLEARHPQPALLPTDAQRAARVRAFCLTLAADVQPFHNLATLEQLKARFAADEAARSAWMRHWIERGLAALESEAIDTTPFVFGDTPTLADCVLVPQLFAAERFGCDAARYPRLAAVGARCRELPAFQRAHPDQQPDAER